MKALPGTSALAVFLTAAAALFPLRDAGALDPSHYTVPLSGRCRPPLDGAFLELKISSSDPSFSLPDTPFQRLMKIRRRGGTSTALLRAGAPGNIEAPGPGLTDNTRFLNLENTDIRKTARRLSLETPPIDAVERFVYSHIHRKTFGIPLLPAAAVYRGRAGDCTEHSVLGIALLRSMGIPSRAVVGMIFSEEFAGMINVFVFHMWVEAYYGGRWVLVDSTRPGAKQPWRYIAFTCHSLKSEAPLSYLGALAAIKNLRVECP